MRTLKYVSLSFVLVLAIAATGFLVRVNSPLAPMLEALIAQQSNSQVQVIEEGWIVFQPAGAQVDTGLILYPGGRVDPPAYAPVARAIVEHGYLVPIVSMPFNLAVFVSARDQDVIAAYPQIQHWAVSGNHAQFGWYGNQPGDNPATISRTDQQAQVVADTLELLGRVE